MDTNTTSRGETAMLMTATLDLDVIARLSPVHQQAIHRALTLAASVLHGVAIEPRCADDDNRLNAAGAIIEDLREFFDLARDRLVKEAKKRALADPDANEYRLWLILEHTASMHDDLADLAALAAGFVAEQKRVEWDAAHRGKAVAA